MRANFHGRETDSFVAGKKFAASNLNVQTTTPDATSKVESSRLSEQRLQKLKFEHCRSVGRLSCSNSSISIRAPPATRRWPSFEIAPACTLRNKPSCTRSQTEGVRRNSTTRTAAPGDLWLVRPIMQSSWRSQRRGGTGRVHNRTFGHLNALFAFRRVQV